MPARKFGKYLAVPAAMIAAAAIIACASQPPASAHVRTVIETCPVTGSGPYVTCIRIPNTAAPQVGQQITDATGSAGCRDTPWQVTDYTGAPMAWVNCYGLYSGGDGGKMPGALICSTYGTVASVACLTGEGTVTLQATGPSGPTGPVETLTPTNVAFVVCLQKAGETLSSCRAAAAKVAS